MRFVSTGLGLQGQLLLVGATLLASGTAGGNDATTASDRRISPRTRRATSERTWSGGRGGSGEWSTPCRRIEADLTAFSTPGKASGLDAPAVTETTTTSVTNNSTIVAPTVMGAAACAWATAFPVAVVESGVPKLCHDRRQYRR